MGKWTAVSPDIVEAETVVCGVGRTRMAKLVDVAIANQIHHRLVIRGSGAAVAGSLCTDSGSAKRLHRSMKC